MGKKTKTLPRELNCACVIHGSTYSFNYVDTLYKMLSRNFSIPIKLHVYTEHDRSVPDSYIKHSLVEWPKVAGPKKSWWYKLQLFDRSHYSGDLLYFDLDVVIVNNLDWILYSNLERFWTIHDFKRLYKKDYLGINSSVMYWNTEQFAYIWDNIRQVNIQQIISRFRGDQDYLQTVIPKERIEFFPDNQIISWRWQALKNSKGTVQQRFRPDLKAGTEIRPENSVLVFHGQPKPHEVQDPVIKQFWQ